ncbi:MAG: YgeY family selenium metabolism-linked hydrolase [Tissierellaceae bacterium]|nr:YgeY family selenium metabolism-linked hydrolase [Tissierellaceae bacterium]
MSFIIQRRDEVIKLTQDLVRTKSYSGEEDKASEVLQKFFREKDFDEVRVDKFGNTIGTIKGNRPGKSIVFDGHLDTVPITDESLWTYPPFSGEIQDNKIHGRGTSDMKGALAAMAVAAACFAEDTKRDFPGEIHVAGVVHEECFEGVAAREISKEYNPDYVIIGEASELNLKIGQRGRAEIRLEVFGKAAHSANPEKGINAVYKICNIIEEIKKLEPTEHPVLGKGILELTDIKSSPYPGASVVPEYAVATYDRRLLVGETKESVLKPLQDLLDRMMHKDPELKAKVSYAVGEEACYTGNKIQGERFFPGWIFDHSEDFIQNIYKGIKALGIDAKITHYHFCTNASHYAGEAGIKTIGIGPSKENLAHTLNEYAEIEQLEKVCDIYVSIMETLLK